MSQAEPLSKTKKADLSITIGIDVSKNYLDAAVYPTGEMTRVVNDRKGHTTLLRWLGGRRPTRVVFEATGPYHRELEKRLDAAGLPFVKANPRQARRFAEATGTLAKTDRVDAQLLAQFGALLEPIARPVRSDAQLELAELVAARRGLMRDRTATLNRLQILNLDLLKRHARYRLRQVDAQLVSLDAAIARTIDSDPVLARRHNILVSIPGVSAITAAALLADMPELGSINERQAASLAGLAPVTRQSGKWQGKSFIRGGRSNLRQALYMPALVATRFNPDLKRSYETLIQRGKPAKLAITAIMRRLLVLANALVRDDRTWALKTT